MEAEKAFDTADLDAAFEAIFLSEETAWQKGFQEGVEAGTLSGSAEGEALGLSKGAEIGSELGFYKGFAAAFLSSDSDPNPKSDHIPLETSDEKLSALISDSYVVLKDVSITTAKEKVQKPINKLLSMIDAFPQSNIKEEDILEQLQQIRAKFKLVCALLKVVTDIGAKKETTF